MKRLLKHRVAIVGAVAAALVTAGCGGDGGPSASGASSAAATTTTTEAAANADPVEWSGAFCEGIGPSIEGVVALLQTMFENAEDPVAQKQAMVDYTATTGKALTDAAAKLEDIGAPSAETQALHDELVKFFTDGGAALTKANTDLATLDPNDPAFAEKLGALGDESADPSALQEQIKKLQEDPELGKAFNEAPQCVEMAEKLKTLGS